MDNGLDLAALACSPADSEDFVRLARTILTKRPEKCLHVLRSAVTALDERRPVACRFERNDIIVEYDGKKIEAPADLQRGVGHLR